MKVINIVWGFEVDDSLSYVCDSDTHLNLFQLKITALFNLSVEYESILSNLERKYRVNIKFSNSFFFFWSMQLPIEQSNIFCEGPVDLFLIMSKLLKLISFKL